MDVVMSGASGFIGTALTKSLVADGHRVVPLVRRPVAAGEDAARWDPAAGTIDAAVLEGADAVVHLAGAGIGDERLTAERKKLVIDSRRQGTMVLAEAVAAATRPPPALLSGSAIGYYGDRGDEVLTETSPAGEGFLPEICLAWEGAARPAVDAGVRTVFLRTGIVLDDRGGALKPMALLAKCGVLGRLGSGKQWMSWISMADYVRAVRCLIDNEVAGPVNLTGPAPATNADFTKALGRAVHRPTIIPVPSFAPKLILGAERADALLFTSGRILPTVLERHGFTFDHPDLDTAFASALH